jgi:hypothetical protein
MKNVKNIIINRDRNHVSSCKCEHICIKGTGWANYVRYTQDQKLLTQLVQTVYTQLNIEGAQNAIKLHPY